MHIALIGCYMGAKMLPSNWGIVILESILIFVLVYFGARENHDTPPWVPLMKNPNQLNGLIFYGFSQSLLKSKLSPLLDYENFKIFMVLNLTMGLTPLEVKFVEGK